MIVVNCTNPPQRADGGPVDMVATMRSVVATYPGFPVYILQNPTQFNGEGQHNYPKTLDGAEWKAAYDECKGAELWPRIGGCKNDDLPALKGPLDTMCKRFRPSKVILADYGSADDAMVASERYRTAIHANSQVYAPEANAKQPYLPPGPNLWIVAQWFLFDFPAPITGAVSGYHAGRWKIREVLATGAKAIVEITDDSRRGLGFTSGVEDKPATFVALAKMFHAIDPANVIVSVRMSGMSAAQVAVLRGLNT